eukprot:1083483-Amphidinium_carterae.1
METTFVRKYFPLKQHTRMFVLQKWKPNGFVLLAPVLRLSLAMALRKISCFGFCCTLDSHDVQLLIS